MWVVVGASHQAVGASHQAVGASHQAVGASHQAVDASSHQSTAEQTGWRQGDGGCANLQQEAVAERTAGGGGAEVAEQAVGVGRSSSSSGSR